MKRLIHIFAFWGSIVSVNAAVLTFSNLSPISLNEPATTHTAPTVASPYPSTISVSSVTDPVSKIRVSLNNITQGRPDDMEMVLVSPTGVKFVFLSDAGGASTPASGVNITFDDAAASQIPDAGPLVSGTFQPTCVDSANNVDTNFPSPAPAGPYNKAAPKSSATFASVFTGVSVNGTWSLYAVDDSLNTPQTASIGGGWSIEITTSVTQVPSVTSLTSAPNPSFTTAPSNAVVFTALVTKQSDGTPVTVGTVTFKEGTTTLAANVAVNGTGRAFYTNSSFAEGSHAITANYNGDPSFLTSSANTTQTVDNHTVVTGSTFCNTGNIVFADAIGTGPASVYPSHVFVSGLPGTISKVTVQLKNLNHARPDDIDLLLVSPNGAKFILMSDAGGTTAVGAANLTFDDSAASTLPDASAFTTGTYRPSSFTPADSFPAPAPAGPYLTPEAEGSDKLTAFNGVSPNGTWSLYVVDDIANAGQSNTIGSGWCLTFVTSGDAPTTSSLASSSNPSFKGDAVTFTATITSSGSPVTQGTVTFTEGAVTLAGPIALNASGQARYTNSTLAEGTHTISAFYNGSPGAFNTSSGNVIQEVNNHTVVTGISFCNTGTVLFAEAGSPGPSTPYPSHVFVSGITGTVSKVTVQIKNLNHARPDDIDILLVGPTGAGLVLMSDVGGVLNAATGATIIFDDAASSLLADDGPLVSGTNRPTQIGTGDVFPGITPGTFGEPAPGGTATLTSGFNSLNPNGTWSLYVVDDTANGGQVASITAGWCIDIVACVAATISAAPSTCPNSLGNQANGPPGVGSYAWTINNGTITSATNLQTITYTAGSSGNATLNLTVASTTGCIASGSTNVLIADTAMPTITCPSNITLTATGHCPVTVSFTATANDNCGNATITMNPPSGSAFPIGTTPIAVKATDGSGNTNTCSFNVTVLASAPPVLNITTVNTNLVISWPMAYPCYALQFTSALLTPSNAWILDPGPFSTNAGQIWVTNAFSSTNRFYRLSY